MTRTRGLFIGTALALAACGGTATSDTNGTGPGSTTPPATAPATGDGWVDGEPSFSGGDGSAPGDGEYDSTEAYSATDAPAADMETSKGGGAGGGVVEPAPVPEQGLRAGSIDDNDDLTGFVDYLDRITSLGIETRGIDPTGRILVEVRGANGLPIDGADVTVEAGGTRVATLRTTADGTVRVLPALYGAADATELTITSGGSSTTAAPGSSVRLDVGEPGGASGPIDLDIVFLLDATGSMGDEIDQLKTTIDSIATRIGSLESAPRARFGMTLYRDLEDSFVTATYDLTSDLGAFRAELDKVRADGGGDYAEALDEGLAEALTKPSWGDPATTVQLVFLVADAPPQIARQVDVPYVDSIVDAAGRGIKIFPVASSESDDQAEAVFRQMAMATGARFVFLAYGAGGAATGGSTDIDSTDYEELALDDLVVRLVSEELAALTGDDPTPPSTTQPPVTNPDGQ